MVGGLKIFNGVMRVMELQKFLELKNSRIRKNTGVVYSLYTNWTINPINMDNFYSLMEFVAGLMSPLES